MKGFDEKILFCKLSNRDMVKMTQTKNQMTMIPILMNWIFSILMMMMIWHFLLRSFAIGGWFKYAFIKLVRYLIFAPSLGYLINNLCSLLSSSLKYLHKQIMFISFLFAQVHLVFGILKVHRSNGEYCKRSNDKDESLLELKLNSEHNAQCRG